MAVTASIKTLIAATLSGTAGLSAVSAPVSVTAALSLANGTAADQANQMFSDQRTLTASNSEDLDLSGVLLDALGNAVAFTKIKAIYIGAAKTNTNNVVVGGAALNGFITMFGASTDKINVPPGGSFLLTAPGVAGFAVTAATGDLLKVANSGAGTSVVYDIVLIGVE